MISAALLVVASIVIPFTLPLRIPGLANAVNGLFGSFFLVIGLIRLKNRDPCCSSPASIH